MFVQVIQGHAADVDELRAATDRWAAQVAPGAIGWLGMTLGVTADGMAIAAARFESADAARRNSERPEQHQWWMETSKLFAGDVVFHDCNEVHEFGRGGFDNARFVQVIQGRFTDQQRAIELLKGSEQPLRDFRPDVLGGLVCLHGDGGFTQVVYFTSEEEARAGERKEPPPDATAMRAEQMSLMQDLRYYDITEPILLSPR